MAGKQILRERDMVADEALRKKIRADFPPPARFDFRLRQE
jgi:hypothetical protein